MPARLLLIDDEEDFLEVFGDWLAFKGYDVATANDGAEGLEKLRSGKYDLVLLDLMMPNVDGFEFCRLVRADKDLHNVPIVILSAIRRMNGQSRIGKLDVDGYLEKMADKGEISFVIERVLSTRKTSVDHLH